MQIDCDQCAMQDTTACQDCVVGHLLHDLLGPIEVDRERAEALDVLAEAGLVPELKLVKKAVNE